MPSKNRQKRPDVAIAVVPSDLIGAATVAAILGIDRSNVTRGVHAGTIPYIAQLDGPGGAYVFDRTEIDPMKEHP